MIVLTFTFVLEEDDGGVDVEAVMDELSREEGFM